MMTMNATTTTPTSAFSWSSKTRSPKPLSRSPPDQTQTQSTRGNRRKRRRKRKEKEASPNPLSGNNNAFSSRLLRAGGSRATCVVLCGVSARERELVFFMRYKPTSLLFFCFSLVYFFLFFFSSIFLLVSFFSLSRVCSLTKANFYTSTKGGSEKRSKKPTFLRPFGLTAMISAHGYSVDVQKYDSRHIFRCLPNSTLRDLPPYLCAECP